MYIGFFQFPTLTYDLHQSHPEAIRHGLLQLLGRQWCASLLFACCFGCVLLQSQQPFPYILKKKHCAPVSPKLKRRVIFLGLLVVVCFGKNMIQSKCCFAAFCSFS